ncbi:aldo/keto reductase [Streptomyces sp. NA04227]|uniref:aldo/keto reductase n=1 Tax=Streptomyces sp. NA04227 TaxID=2742136 RepID=UPI001592A8AC|nr:aldo/keto reductase [Streptomyces sp. NA04227]QKW08323.1 aldo/keto reductase [Streptomyces sp. NA04227]
MRYTLFGRTGLRVSELGLGAMTFGTQEAGAVGKEVSGRLLDLYTEAGGNFVDTADIYMGGTSESVLGELLEGRREEYVLASKYTCTTRPGDPNSGGNHRKNLVQSVEASLRRLRTDRLDVLWVHARDNHTPVEETMRALDDLVRAGKVLYLGVSDWAAWEIAQANTLAELRAWTSFAGSQLRYHLLDRSPERELLPQARAFEQAVMVWGPLAGGRLTGKYLRGESGRFNPSGGNGQGGDGSSGNEREDRIVTEVGAIAEQGGWSPAQVCLAWLRTRPGNIVPLLGATKESQLKDNLGCLDVHLDEAALTRLDELSAVPLGFPHEFLLEPRVVRTVYGDKGADIQRRS